MRRWRKAEISPSGVNQGGRVHPPEERRMNIGISIGGIILIIVLVILLT